MLRYCEEKDWRKAGSWKPEDEEPGKTLIGEEADRGKGGRDDRKTEHR